MDGETRDQKHVEEFAELERITETSGLMSVGRRRKSEPRNKDTLSLEKFDFIFLSSNDWECLKSPWHGSFQLRTKDGKEMEKRKS